MRTLVCSDAHANLVALDALLDSVDADRIWYLGDAVDLGPSPAQTVKRLDEAASVWLQGNHDRAVVDTDPEPDTHDGGELGRQWAKRQLSAAAIRRLESLSRTRRLSRDGSDWRLHHGDFAPPATHSLPRWENRLRPGHPEPVFEAVADRYPESTVVHGHSHVPYIETVAGTTFVCPGAVGYPRQGGSTGVATYALLEDGAWSLGECAYDIDAVCAAVRETSLPSHLADDWAARFHYGE